MNNPLVTGSLDMIRNNMHNIPITQYIPRSQQAFVEGPGTVDSWSHKSRLGQVERLWTYTDTYSLLWTTISDHCVGKQTDARCGVRVRGVSRLPPHALEGRPRLSFER
eukprot:1185676-Prorocentrum_minimum.AAC.3